MKNKDIYRTPGERAAAYHKFCSGKQCEDCKVKDACSADRINGVFAWMDLDVSILPCPFCGSDMVADRNCGIQTVRLICTRCDYAAPITGLVDSVDTIDIHNKISRFVKRGTGIHPGDKSRFPSAAKFMNEICPVLGFDWFWRNESNYLKNGHRRTVIDVRRRGVALESFNGSDIKDCVGKFKAYLRKRLLKHDLWFL